jgi:hypothetical protein
MYAVRRTLFASLFVVLAAGAATLPTLPARGDDAKAPATPAPATTAAASPAPASPAPASPAPAPAPTATAGSAKVTITTDAGTLGCREQAAQAFLIRGNWFPRTNDAEKQKEARKLFEESLKYRTEKYGYFEGYGSAKLNPHPPKFYAKSTTFMGMSVQVNERIIAALKCVEAALKSSPAGNEYKPRAMGGIRFHNTYRGMEISNHVYGIAVDIEPDRNSCCGCVAPWPDHPLCKAKNKTVWERMAMPKSWVDTFERFGFYWLGHDVLQDTMHLEFLGDPDKITEPVNGAPLPAGAVAAP